MIKCRLIIVDNYYFCSYFNGIEFQLKNFIATTSTFEHLVFHQLQ